MTEKNTNSNGHKQLSTKWLQPDLYKYIVNSMDREGLSQTAVVNRAIRADMELNGSVRIIGNKCHKCGTPNDMLNKNGLCIICVFSADADLNESKMFKETGEELREPNIVIESDFQMFFGKEKPICSKCDKPVDMFFPLYVIEYPCSRFVLVKCHGEIEIRMFTEIKLVDGKPDVKDLLSGFFAESE